MLCLCCVQTDIVHMTCRSVTDDAQSDLQPVADLLFNSDADDAGMWRSYCADNVWKSFPSLLNYVRTVTVSDQQFSKTSYETPSYGTLLCKATWKTCRLKWVYRHNKTDCNHEVWLDANQRYYVRHFVRGTRVLRTGRQQLPPTPTTLRLCGWRSTCFWRHQHASEDTRVNLFFNSYSRRLRQLFLVQD